ncbi:anti-sigma factor [Saccharopolyspora cebuensis]|uniref:Regulator of SigK n=1 Tax=Saccharopolyspora cebuensis TaxID=418759 RepID=A0ABV4CGJ7_9PSEU
MNTDPSTLTGAYAVDAVVGEERAEFERHLASCADCAQEVAELRATAARLGADISVPPPEELKAKVLEQVSRTRQDPPRVTELRARRRPARPRVWTTRLATAAAVVGIALAGVFGGMAWHTQQQLAQVTEQMREAGDAGREMAEVLQAPDAELLRSSMGTGETTAVVSRQTGQAMFLGSDLPSPPPSRVYQLWFIGEGGPVSAGLLEADPGEQTSSVVAPLPPGTQALAVTVEPAGGSAQPTADPVLTLSL